MLTTLWLSSRTIDAISMAMTDSSSITSTEKSRAGGSLPQAFPAGHRFGHSAMRMTLAAASTGNPSARSAAASAVPGGGSASSWRQWSGGRDRRHRLNLGDRQPDIVEQAVKLNADIGFSADPVRFFHQHLQADPDILVAASLRTAQCPCIASQIRQSNSNFLSQVCHEDLPPMAVLNK
jgi:hypothetical protein